MSKKITANHIKDSSVAPEFNVSKIRALTDKQAEERAKKDPDAPIVNARFAKNQESLTKNKC
ncbi:MAG: hypothetical protein B0W54_23495 [Cellvibrio sp. 79]|nr:MAG: hypothetical protein B0W54_23495 [Cellvibrio sp. 79]